MNPVLSILESPQVQVSVGVLLIFVFALAVRAYGIPPALRALGGGGEEGGSPGFPECEYGSLAWSFVACYGKQALVVAPALLGLGLVLYGISGMVRPGPKKSDPDPDSDSNIEL